MIFKLVRAVLSKSKFLKGKLYNYILAELKNSGEEANVFLGKLKKQMSDEQRRWIGADERSEMSVDGRFTPREEDKYKWMQEMNVATILDVGAWQGDSAKQFHVLFPKANIYSFEPLKDCFDKLTKLKDHIPSLQTFHFGLGDQEQKVEINRSEFSPSSSLLKMADLHKENFPFTAGERKELIDIKTLDSVVSGIPVVGTTLLKIDVQGYEDKVLKGAMATLEKVDIIIIELSFTTLYEGQPEFAGIYSMLRENGFTYIGSWSQLISPKNGAILQQNGIFVKSEQA